MQISKVWTWASSILLLKLSYCCIANHLKGSGLKKTFLFLTILWVYWKIPLFVSPGLTYAAVLDYLAGLDWKVKNGLPHMSGTLVLTVKGSPLHVVCLSLIV